MSRRSRNPIRTGVLGALVLALVLAVVASVPQGYFLLRTRPYTVEFANAAGLTPDAKVHVAGVPAGRVTGVQLAGDRVRVSFRLDRGQPLGTTTSAAVKIATVMGTRYLAVQPSGPGELAAGARIPENRTSVPYDLGKLSNSAHRTSSQLDVGALHQMMATVNEVAPRDPDLVGQTLQGVSGAAQLVGRHKQQLQQMLLSAQSVSSELVQQRGTLVNVLGDADLVLRTLDDRRHTIHQLVVDVDALTAQLDRFLREDGPQVGAVLADLHRVSDSLVRNENALSDSVAALGPASKGLSNATGNGKWGDVAGPAGPVPDNLLCTTGLVRGCR